MSMNAWDIIQSFYNDERYKREIGPLTVPEKSGSVRKINYLEQLYEAVKEKYPQKITDVISTDEVFGVAKWAFENFEKDEVALLDQKRTSLFRIFTMIAKMAEGDVEPILLLTPNREESYRKIVRQAKELLPGFKIFEGDELDRFTSSLDKKHKPSSRARLVILKKSASMLKNWKNALNQATKGESDILSIVDLGSNTSMRQITDHSSINQALQQIKDGARKSLALHMTRGVLDEYPGTPFPLYFLCEEDELEESVRIR